MARIKPLPQIALTNNQPAFYDIESATTLELISKLYAYVQNMVTDYNNFAKQINTEIKNFKNSTNQDIECFKNHINNLMLNYIESIDTKINLQDTKIEDAIEYMKDNIVETATNLFNTALENGNIIANLGTNYDSENEELTLYIEGQEVE